MKIHRIILVFLAAAPLLWACDDMMEPKQTEEVDDERLWTVPDMAQGVLMQAYKAMPSLPDSYDNNFLDAATDNAVTNSLNSNVYKLGLGAVTATNNPLDPWDGCYTQLQNIHLFLLKGLTEKTKYSSDADTDAKEKEQLRAEALYLRAWWSFRLLQHYGGRTETGEALGYPIVTEFTTPEMAADYSRISRNTYEECVEQICRDCDAAALVLPAKAQNEYIGRATSLMAEFLKARTLLYAASPAYQPAEIVRIDGMGRFTVLDQESYRAKWVRAAEQAWKVMNISGFGDYAALKRTEIVDVNESSSNTPANYVARYFFQTNGMEKRHYPPYYFGSCNTAPSQNLVDAYPMKANGYPILHNESGYDPENPYAGREDRFALTVYHHGSKFGENDSYIDVIYGRKDSEAFMNGGNRASRTGYYLSKFMSQKVNLLDPIQSSTSIHFYAPMRKAEIFLSFAEAANEAWGPKGTGEEMSRSAYDVIREIRQKSGGIANDLYIEEVKASQEEFRKLILNERRLEFAFENLRFWDLRRCLLPLDEEIRRVVVTESETNNEDGTKRLSYDTKVKVEDRKLNDIRYYYLPIPYAEMRKNPAGMINNLGY